MCPWCKKPLVLKRFGRIGRGMFCSTCNLWFSPFDRTPEGPDPWGVQKQRSN